ncbi:MAG: glycosyltransferase [Lachnospiraceae bacterium]|nr:glycosyltransferase [Lachnospiraceae bacterium]
MNETEPLISVIVPVYKVEPYLEKCVRSIQNQTYENLEIILVDDGSPDRCGQICDVLAKHDARVRTVHRANGGLSAARNSGLSVATGELVGFVDSDDYIDVDMFETLYKAIFPDSVGLAVCMARDVNEQGNLINKRDFSEFVTNYSGCDASRYLFQTLNNSVWNKLFRSKLIGEMKFPEGRIHGEDFIFLLQYMKNVSEIAVIDAPKYNYVHREGSITKSTFSKKKLDEILSKDDIRKIVVEDYPDFVSYADKWCFQARLNVVRGISLAGVHNEWKIEKKDCLQYLKSNYPNVKNSLSKKEKTEYILQIHLSGLYPYIIRTALKFKQHYEGTME